MVKTIADLNLVNRRRWTHDVRLAPGDWATSRLNDRGKIIVYAARSGQTLATFEKSEEAEAKEYVKELNKES
jgi:hypothetical protein